jgi:predicted RNA binding protein YcfA (HicA-like mRNA interferase family)
VVKEEPTRKITKRLKAAGFARTDAEGSHGKWTHPSGAQVSIPDGHRTISPGVVRQVNNAITAATKLADDDEKGEDK